MNDTLTRSYAACQQVTRHAASNFYYGFLVLPRAKRQAMHALYAFLRKTDDLADEDGPADVRRRALDDWRASLDRALSGACNDDLMPALVDTVQRYHIQPAWLHATIDGVCRDQDEMKLETFDDLKHYCYQVAGVVGLSCVSIWGLRDPSRDITRLAIARGAAFQMTNILRDLKEDADHGRVYLPEEDLRRFGYTIDDLKAGLSNDAFRNLMRFEVARADSLYRESAELSEHLLPEGQAALSAMSGVYHRLLEEIKRRDGDVFGERIRLSAWQKFGIAARSFWPRPIW